MALRTPGTDRREQYRNEFFKDEEALTFEEKEKGWFRATRTLPLILSLLADKRLSGKLNPSSVYLELLARHIDSGVIEMKDEAEHASAAGFFSKRAVRSWQERMQILERNGFIKTQKVGSQRYKFVLLVHPTVAVKRLRDKKKVSDDWWAAYRARQIEIKEDSFEDRQKKKAAKVVPIAAGKSAVNE
jgi:hypothetical protein